MIGGEPTEQLVEAYHNVVASPEFREMVRQRERARHNEASALANAKLEERIKLAGRLKAKGMSVNEIVELTDLSVDEVLKA